MNKKHIAFIIYNLGSGGAERVLTTLANKFTNYYKVHIITIIKTESFYQLDNSIKVHHCRENEIINSNIFLSLQSNISLYYKIKNILKGEQICLSISFMTSSNVLCCLASNALKIPSIISERTNPYVKNQNFVWKNLIKYSYPSASNIVVQSQLAKEYYSKIADSKKIVILPNPLSKKLTNSKNILPERNNVILNVGRLVSSKNQDLLIRAFSNINNNDWKLILIGDGPLLSEYKELVNKLNKNNNIIFIGKSNDVAVYYNTSKIFAFTSKYEGFPNALIEAMYFELASISTDCPSGPTELIDHNVNGILINIGDQKELEKQLKRLMNNDSLCNSFGKKGYETASHYDEDIISAKWNDLIEKLLMK